MVQKGPRASTRGKAAGEGVVDAVADDVQPVADDEPAEEQDDDGDDDDDDEGTPLSTVTDFDLSDEDVKDLGEASGKIINIDFPLDEHLKTTQAILRRMQKCGTVSKATGEAHGLPRIDVDDSVRDQVRVATALVTLDNLQKLKQPGFVEGVTYRPLNTKAKSELCTVVRYGGEYVIERLDANDIIQQLEEVSCFIKETKSGIKHAEPKRAVKNGVSRQSLPLPLLRQVMAVPRWSYAQDADMAFSFAHTIGYDPQTATFIGKDFDITWSNDAPTDDDVAWAIGVLDDLIGEFPYAEEASHRNALALAVSMAMRNIFLTSPMFVIGAEDPASGKTLLAETLHCACFGTVPTPNKVAYGEGQQERRNLTAVIRDAPTDTDVLWFDEIRKSNQTSEIVSDTLNAIATAAAGKYRDRPVYQREAIDLDVQRTFIITGNNLHLGPELQRRTVRVTLQRNGKPFTRTEDELREHAVASQEKYHQAVATLVRNWMAKGCPPPKGSEQFPSFNTWLRIVGGILESAGVTGLRKNPDIVGPYTAARAAWLTFLYETVPHKVVGQSRVINHADIITVLAGGTKGVHANEILGLLEELIHHGGSEAVTWERLHTAVELENKTSILLSKAMRLYTTATWRGADGRSIHYKRISKGKGLGVRYELSLSGLPERRGGRRR